MPDVTTVLARRRVPLGFLFGVAILWLAQPTVRSLEMGGAIALAGEALRVWAAGHLEKGSEVTQSGPYRLISHPLYVGSALLGVGVAVAAARLSVAAAAAVYLVSTLGAAIRHEEANMRAAFGGQYDAYLQSRGRPVARTFSLARAMRNKEYRAVTGLIIVGALLAFKAGHP